MVAIGNALVDVLASAGDDDLEPLGLVKGTMQLVDLERSQAIYASMGPTVEASGGSAANTVAGVAALGGRAAFIGRVADDLLGQVFTHDIRSIGVAFDPTPTPAVEGESMTGHCLVLVTDDAERTMATHLGVASEFGPGDLHSGHLSSSQVVYLEGYLWDQPAAKAGMREAIEIAHRSEAAVALTLSDPFCVQSHRAEFLELLNGDLELLFANEEEVMLLFGAPPFEDAVEAVAETGVLAVLTRGSAGSVVVTARGRWRCRPNRWSGWSTPPGPGTSSPPASSTASPTASPPRSRPGSGASAPPRSSPTWAPVPRRTSGPWRWPPGCSSRHPPPPSGPPAPVRSDGGGPVRGAGPVSRRRPGGTRTAGRRCAPGWRRRRGPAGPGRVEPDRVLQQRLVEGARSLVGDLDGVLGTGRGRQQHLLDGRGPLGHRLVAQHVEAVGDHAPEDVGLRGRLRPWTRKAISTSSSGSSSVSSSMDQLR